MKVVMPRMTGPLSFLSIVGLSILAFIVVDLFAATEADAIVCQRVQVRFLQYRTTGCPSPIGVCTTAEVDSGPLKGTKTFSMLNAAPSAGLGPVEPAATVSYAGPALITTDKGELNVSFVGVYDTAKRVISEFGRVVGGSGRFARATGILYSYGTVNEAGTVFDSTLTGDVCVSDAA
ncbi:MAG TPA: hypothetical protein VFH48_44005 [Chloroflexota bacterium]|nr:hypothetical protein [Chloroflexota bacterium]